MTPAVASAPGGATARTDGIGDLEVTTMTLDGTHVTVQPCGEMDLSNNHLLAGVVANQLRLARRFIELDLSRLTFCDCTGLRTIVDAHNNCLRVHGTMVLTGVPSRVARLLSLTHLDEALVVDHDPHHARPARGQHLSAVRERKTK